MYQGQPFLRSSMKNRHPPMQMQPQMGAPMGQPMAPMGMAQQFPMMMFDQFQQNVTPFQIDFMNKENRPYIEVHPDEAITPVVTIFNYAARSPEEISFEVGEMLELIGEIDWAWCKARLVKDRDLVGYLPTSHVAELRSLESKPWFFQIPSRVDAERTLLASKNENGSFMIRPSSVPGARFCLSVRDEGKVRHFLIRGNEAEGFHISPKYLFPAVEKLVNFYTTKIAPPVPKLKEPCVRVEAPQTIGLSHEMADKWEINRSMIRLKNKLGGGNFGDVFEGIWNNSTKVAVKTLKQGNLDKADFLKEAENMKKLIHPKVVQLFGVCTKDDPFYIITELMPYGDLLNYLRKGKGVRLGIPSLIDMCAQVAEGMKFLEAKKFVHRDLAARNVLVGEENNCKVADFGFARLTQEDLYIATLKNVKLPVKWTAPEALKLKEFTNKSDVWSFGILCYEVIEKGQSPYPGMENSSIFPQLSKGYRMPKTLMPHCPDKLYGIMLQCWDASPSKRPTFKELAPRLDNFYEEDFRPAK